MRLTIRRLAVGFLLGALVLGAGGRAAMVVFSLVTSLPVNLTVQGTGAVVLTGGLYGLLGAALVTALPDRLGTLGRGLLGGAMLFGSIVAGSALLGQMTAAAASPWLAVLLFAPLAFGFAALFERAVRGSVGAARPA